MQRILILSDSSFSLWQFRRDLIATMLASSMEVVIAVPSGEHADDLDAMGCRIIEIRLNRRTNKFRQGDDLMDQYQQILEKEKPDMVLTYGNRANLCGGLTCREENVPYCANVQALPAAFQRPFFGVWVRSIYRRALKNAKVVFFENAVNAAYFREKKLITKKQEMILSGAGVNLRHYALQPYPENDPIRFLYLGRMEKEKGMDELLAAVKMLYDDCFDIRLDLVGDHDDTYEEQLDVLKAMGVVFIHDFQPDPRPFYGACDCVVMPSHAEGMSNVLLEAAATGRPVIASYIPGCREAVDEARTGFTYRTQDKYALYNAMKRMAQMPRSQRAEMGLAGRARMQELFDKQLVVEDTLNAIFRP